MQRTSVEDAQRMRQALDSLRDEVGQFINAAGIHPVEGSLAAKELATCQYPEQLKTAYSVGNLLLESAADHAFALTRLLVEPVPTIAPWTCARGGLEAAAISYWLLSNRIDSRERISRSFAYRYDGLCQQVKLAGATGDTASLSKSLHRIEEVEAKAIDLGYKPVVNRQGERSGIGQRMPAITKCIAENLDQEVCYRIFSAMAHAHTWALIRLGFQAPNASEPTLLKKAMNSDAAAMLLMTAADTLAKPTWAKACLFGQDRDSLAAILSRRYGEMGLNASRHFWVRDQPS